MGFLKVCLTLGLVHLASSAVCREDGPCNKPAPDKNFDIHEFKMNTPADGWHMEIGDVVARLHIAEVLQGKLLTLDEDYSEMCGRAKVEHDTSNSQTDGVWYGFGGKVANWKCKGSDKLPGTLECDFSSTLGKYNETDIVYMSKTDNKNVSVIVMCFPNGQSGWWSLSTATVLTDEERKIVLDHIEELGFDRNNVVNMYNEKCPKV